MGDAGAVLAALQAFASTVTAKMSQVTAGEPEDQLRAPLEVFMGETARALGWSVVCTGETPLPGRRGQPDYAVHLRGLLAGYIELKAPGTGADPRRYSGHNRDQWTRFRSIPNLLYCDGNEWALYRDGKLVDPLVRLNGDVTVEGKGAVSPRDADAVGCLVEKFLAWEPLIPLDREGKIDLGGFAKVLAPLCRMLRDDVTEALPDPGSPLVHLASDWRQLLFPDATDEQFADAYAQTVAFALLLARSEGAEPLTLGNAVAALAAEHSLLSRALQVLTDQGVRAEMPASLDLLVRLIAAVPVTGLSGPEDPWLYFYEDFLAVYDPKLRKDAGAYYTPVEVVRAQVRLVDDLLVNRLHKSLGFADPDVITLDPAAGTGTYLLGVIDHALTRVEDKQGPGAVPGQATTLAANLYGFELMVGPYAVSELRTTRALRDRGATLPPGGSRVYLTDTLESPRTVPPQLPLFLEPIAEQHAKALSVKKDVPVLVCLGNPPYDRHEAAKSGNKARTGGWVRWGDAGSSAAPIFAHFLDPVVEGGHGIHAKWLYNSYVYFWRWALWKVLEQEGTAGPGVVSFITASSYLFGDAFVGMREHLRRVCDEVWIIDLGGEGRGARKEENIFAIQTPVAIAVAVRYGAQARKRPARVHYTRVEGSRREKLEALASVRRTDAATWEDCPQEWRAPFLPAGRGAYFDWPIIRDLFPWQHSGMMLKRTWPVAPEPAVLARRWRALLASPDRAAWFRETRDRQVASAYAPLPGAAKHQPLGGLPDDAPPPAPCRLAYRSLDRQWMLADSRLGDYLRPDLWRVHGARQVYLVSQLWQVLGSGPALVVCALLPDFHFFKGSYGGKDVIPAYRDAAGRRANVLPGLLDLLERTYGVKVTPEDLVAYVYGVLAQPAFTERFAKELGTRELRVPITKSADIFAKVGDVGARLLWLHTYGERFVPKGQRPGQVQRGAVRCVRSVPGDPDNYPGSFEYTDETGTLRVGDGEFRPVQPDVYNFEVSGLKVVQSWLGYRMKRGAGRKSSPLDDIRPETWTGQFTTELLELLWVLEATVAGYPEQAKVLEAVVSGPCFRADELPAVPDEMRRPPGDVPEGGDVFSGW